MILYKKCFITYWINQISLPNPHIFQIGVQSLQMILLNKKFTDRIEKYVFS